MDSPRGKHGVKDKASHTSVPIHVGMYEYKHKMPQHGSYSRIRLLTYQSEQFRHGVRHSAGIKRNVL